MLLPAGDGLLGKRLGDLPSEDIVTVIKIIFNEIPDSTLNWVHNQELQQNSYALFEGNRTFESAILYYVDGKNSEAYYTLGYVLHNIEDMAVPAHTRQDSHFDMPVPEVIQNFLQVKFDKGEPYEKWAESYTRYNPADLTDKLKVNYKPICKSIDDCLKIIANYSNSNFFSSDTILGEDYESPEVNSYKVEGDYINAYSKDGVLLFKTTREDEKENIIGFEDINKAYWDKLAQEVVLAGVEVVKYFNNQAEKAKKGEIIIERVSETIDPIADFNDFSPYGQVILMYNEGKTFAFDFWKKLKNFGNDFVSHITDTINGFGINAFITSILPGYAVQESTNIPPNFSLPPAEVVTVVAEKDDPGLQDQNGVGGPTPEPKSKVIEKQEMLDDIAEQLDIIARQIQDLINEREKQQNKLSDVEPAEVAEARLPLDVEVAEDRFPLVSGGNRGGGGGSSVNYSKILISEVQIAGITDAKEEFVELYNPNDTEVDLTNWYLQKKTSSGSLSSFATKTLLSGKKISTKGYFLIAREGYFNSLANVFVDTALSDDSTLILKNPNEDIVDKVGWGQAQDYELLAAQNPGVGQSIGRKVLSDGTEEETDNNLNDFELQTPTPNAQNTTYVAPPNPEPTKVVLINEVQIGGDTNEKEEFVELYNPGLIDIDLTGWYVQKKTKTGATFASFVPNTLFADKIIKSKRYFLIGKEGSSFAEVSDITTIYSLAVDNTLVIKNGAGEIIDKVGWGQAQDYEISPAENPEKGQSIQREWDETALVYQDTNDNSVDFEKQPSTPKPSLPRAYIEDATNYTGNFGDNNGAIYYNLTLKWYSKNTNIDFYQLQYKKNNGEWKDWLQNTLETQKDFIAYFSVLSDENIYYFRVRPQDKDGVQGDWKEIKIDLSSPVVINEIALYGANDSKEQWLELYNKTGNPVDLTGWKIVFNGGSINLEGIILAKSYLLLEAVNEGFIGTLSGNNLRLLNEKQRYIDWFYEPIGGWAEGYFTADEKIYSIERISPYSLGSESHNWKINNGGDVFGTPGQQNNSYQIYTYLPLGFGADELLKKSLSPFIISDSNSTVIFKEAVLTIEPGVVVKFHSALSNILVYGTVKAIGSSTDKIIFTAFSDDDCGTIPVCGDSNGDAGALVPVHGNWSGIYFNKDSSNSEFDNAVFKYGGLNNRAVIKVEQSSISIKNSVFSKNLNRGLYLINSSSTVDSTEFSEQNIADMGSIVDPSGIHILGGNPHITNSYFKDNSYGIVIENWSDGTGNIVTTGAHIENNNFENNLVTAIYLDSFGQTYFSGNTALGNRFNSILITADKIPGDLTLQPDTMSYLIRNILTVPEGMTLTLQPGVIMDFQSNWSGIQIDGTLKAIGTTDRPIIFRHYYYDSDWTSPGKWMGLQFSGTSRDSELENIDISLGGAFYVAGQNFGAAIKVDQSSILLKNSVIQKNLNNGLWLINSSSIVDFVRFINNNTLKSDSDTALFIEGGNPQVTNIYIDGSY
jgi:hypothetical protein